jgi:flagellar biosynthesis/type III secretory pathway chaperone
LAVEDWIETDLLVELIGKKLAILEPLRDLSRRQSDLIADGEIQRLLSVLSAKQTLLAELQKLQHRLEPFRKQEPESRTWRCPQDRQHCRELVERCEAMLSEIMLIEKQSESEMAQRRDVALARLEENHSSAEATRAYIRSPGLRQGSLDLSSDG